MKRTIILILILLINIAVCSADEVVIWNGQKQYFVDVSTEGQIDMLQSLYDLYDQCDTILQRPPSNSAQCEVLRNLKDHINAIVNRLDNESLQATNGAWNKDINSYLIRCAQIKNAYKPYTGKSGTKDNTNITIHVRKPQNTAKSKSSDKSAVIGGMNIPNNTPSGAINVTTGEYYPPAAGGVIEPRTGTFYHDVGGGYINTRTGDFAPKNK